MAFVYLHIFPNGKVYVGMTNRTPEIRWENGNGYRTQPLMSKAINKYGWNNVRHEIIASGVSLDEANRIERELIAANMSTDFRFGYNMEHGGNGIGKHSEETKRKIGDSHRGKPIPRYIVERVRITRKNNPATREHCIKLNEKRQKRVYVYSKTGNFLKMYESKRMACRELGIARNVLNRCLELGIKSYKTCIVSAEFLGELIDPAITNGRSVPIDQYGKDGSFIKTWSSIADASNGINADHRGISDCLNGRQKSAYGFFWKKHCADRSYNV